MLGKEPQNILNELSDENKFLVVDMTKRIWMNLPNSRFRFVSVEKSCACTLMIFSTVRKISILEGN